MGYKIIDSSSKQKKDNYPKKYLFLHFKVTGERPVNKSYKKACATKLLHLYL